MKQCPRCGLAKSLNEFGQDRTKPSGRMSHCRDCCNAARRGRYDAQLSRERQRSRDYYAGNRETVIARSTRTYERWKSQNPDGLWIQWLKKAHGLAPEQWFAMLDEQDGLCYLCERPLSEDRGKIAVDHDHRHCPPKRSCGICRRGLAHTYCNGVIGFCADDPAMLRRIADNLERAQSVTAALIVTAPVQETLELEIPGDEAATAS